ncbi:MAG: hypothetical protein GXO86_10470, partial [Chlorobi bacterium]|nr:hypothetical protein [Chlorobiota bacterium]
MIIGPDIIYECPHCNHYISRGSIMSGNTFGATFYSDGSRYAPMLPEFPRITKCTKCHTIFWFDDAKEIEGKNRDDFDTEDPVHADDAGFLNIDEYFEALEKGLCRSNDDEFYIRQRILWEFNKKVRAGKPLFNHSREEKLWRDNINLLLLLIDYEDTNQKILAAELNRNLGKFYTCVEILGSVETDELDWLKKAFA